MKLIQRIHPHLPHRPQHQPDPYSKVLCTAHAQIKARREYEARTGDRSEYGQ